MPTFCSLIPQFGGDLIELFSQLSYDLIGFFIVFHELYIGEL
jgi:hypothetical protein